MSGLFSLTSSDLAAQTGLAHGFYGRLGGVSDGVFASLNCSPNAGDCAAAVEQNRARVVADLGVGAVVTNTQVHSDRVRVVDTDPAHDWRGDGLVTATPGLGLGILSADCAPVLFADPVAGIIGAAHAGWRGALGGVLEAVLVTMRECGAQLGQIRSIIGPTLQANSYQVGAEFVDRFMQDSQVASASCFHQHGAHYYFDLPAYVRLRLRQAGLESVEDLAHDTYADEVRFFSYRRSCHRQQPHYGRQLSVIGLRY